MAFSRGIILFLLSLSPLFPAEIIPLETVSPTVFRHTWTPKNGFQERIVGKNLSGNPIRIAGQEFRRGISGHAPMSYVYNLSGKAIELEAEIGMDDQDSQAEPKLTATSRVFAEILVDRKVVLRQELAPGEKARKIRINLQGKHQLELRGDYGAHFLNQNIMWCNPNLTVINGKEFRKSSENLRMETQKADSFQPVYPPAPNWKTARIEKIPFDCFKNAYRITTRRQEIVIVPELGGRILHYSRPGDENILYRHPNSSRNYQNRMIRGKAGDFAGGHFMRFTPVHYFYPADPILKHGNYQISFPSDGTIVMTSALSPQFFLRYEYRLKITEESLEITNRITNQAPFPQMLGCWPITRVVTGKITSIEVPGERETPPQPLYCSRNDLKHFLKNGTKLLTDAQFHHILGKKEFELKYFSNHAFYRIKTENGTSYSIRFENPEKQNADPPIHLFLCKDFTEFESHSATRPCPPQESMEFRETWSLAPF